MTANSNKYRTNSGFLDSFRNGFIFGLSLGTTLAMLGRVDLHRDVLILLSSGNYRGLRYRGVCLLLRCRLHSLIYSFFGFLSL